MDPFVPVTVSNYSEKEFESCYLYYQDRQWLQHPQSRPHCWEWFHLFLHYTAHYMTLFSTVRSEPALPIRKLGDRLGPPTARGPPKSIYNYFYFLSILNAQSNLLNKKGNIINIQLILV